MPGSIMGSKNIALTRETLRALVEAGRPLAASSLPSSGMTSDTNLRMAMVRRGLLSFSKATGFRLWSVTERGRQALADDAAGLAPLGSAHKPSKLAVVAARLEEGAIPEPNSGCWIWTRHITTTGYGYLHNSAVNSNETHRISYILRHGSVPDGLVLDHLCRVRCCCNPDHLEAVTFAENIYRGNSRAAQNRRKTHCHRGHPFSGENLMIAPSGSRQCRECLSQANRRNHRLRMERKNKFSCTNPIEE